MLDRTSPIPLYYQLKLEIKKMIEAGKLKPGDALPSEDTIAKTFGVSRFTVRQAFQSLVNEGLIYKIQGKGTFVKNKETVSSLSRLAGFTEEMKMLGKETSSKVLKNKLVEPPEYVALAFNIDRKSKILVLSRIRYEDEKPRALEIAYLNIIAYPQMKEIKDRDMSKESLYRILKDEMHIFPVYAEEELEVIKASAKIARALNIKKGECVLHMKRLTKSDENIPFEYVISYYRKDKFKLKVILRNDL